MDENKKETEVNDEKKHEDEYEEIVVTKEFSDYISRETVQCIKIYGSNMIKLICVVTLICSLFDNNVLVYHTENYTGLKYVSLTAISCTIISITYMIFLIFEILRSIEYFVEDDKNRVNTYNLWGSAITILFDICLVVNLIVIICYAKLSVEYNLEHVFYLKAVPFIFLSQVFPLLHKIYLQNKDYFSRTKTIRVKKIVTK